MRVEGVVVYPVAAIPESFRPTLRRLGVRFKNAAERKENILYAVRLKLAKARILAWLMKTWSNGSEAARGLDLTSIAEPKPEPRP